MTTQEQARAARVAEFEAAVASPKFSHARWRRWCYVAAVYVYHRDAASPTGVSLAAALDESEGADDILRRLQRAGALSPVEPR